MKVCITPNSLKLFGTYVNRQLGSQLTEDKDVKSLMSDIYELSTKTFSSTELTEAENNEIVLQHMSVVPQIVLKHLAENPKIKYKAKSAVESLAQEVLESADDVSAESFERIINRFGQLVGNKDIIIPEKDYLERFKGVSQVLFKTSNQEAIWDEENGYNQNIVNPKKIFEFTVSRELIKSNNQSVLKFKLTTLGKLRELGDFVDTVESSDPNKIMLVLVDASNNIVKFNEAGQIDANGKIPGYTIETNSRALKYQTQVIAESYQAKGLTKKEALKNAKEDLKDFIEYIEKQSKSEKEVFLNIDVKGSSLGFVAFDRNNPTQLKDVSNLNTPDASLQNQSDINKSFYPVIKLKNTNKTYRVFPNSLDLLTESEIEILHHLLTAEEVKFDSFKSAIDNRNRLKFISYFVQSQKNIFEYIPAKKQTKYSEAVEATVILGNEVIPAKDLTIDRLKEWINQKFDIEVSENQIGDSKVLESAEQVTHLNQIFRGKDGKLYQRKGPVRNFANSRNLNMDDLILGGSRLPLKLENGVVITENPRTLRDNVTKNGYTNIVLNENNEIVAMGSYLKFEKSLDELNTEEEFGIPEVKFKSIAERNQPNQREQLSKETKAEKIKRYRSAWKSFLKETFSEKELAGLYDFIWSQKPWRQKQKSEIIEEFENEFVEYVLALESNPRALALSGFFRRFLGDAITFNMMALEMKGQEVGEVDEKEQEAAEDGTYLRIEGEINKGRPFYTLERIRDFKQIKKIFQDAYITKLQTNNVVPSEAQNERALEWFLNSPLSQVVTLNFIDGVSEYGPNFLANFIGNTINLYSGASKSEIYHEAFHAFFDGILNQKQREEIYSTLKKQGGQFTTVVKGQTKRIFWKNATNIELEEYLAESFREFALSDGKKTRISNNKIKAFFQKLKNILDFIFAKISYSQLKALNKSNALVDTMFNTLFKGEFTSDMFVAQTNEAKWKSEEIETETGATFSLEEMSLVMDSMQSLLAEFINKGLNISRDQAVQQKAVTYLKVMAVNKKDSEAYKKAAAAYKQIQKSGLRNGSGIYQLQTNPLILQLAIDYIKNRLQQEFDFIEKQYQEQIKKDHVKGAGYSNNFRALAVQRALLDKVLFPENFGNSQNLEKLILEDKNNTILGVFLNNYSPLNLSSYLNFPEQLKVLEESEEVEPIIDEYEVWFGRGGQEILLENAISEATKNILSSVRQYSNQGKGDPVLNPLGVQKMVPFTQSLAKVARLLRNVDSAMEMSRILKDAAQTDMEIAQVFERLGDISTLELAVNATAFEHSQWTSFSQSMNKPEVLLKEFIIENEIELVDPMADTEKTSSSSVTVKVGKSQSDSLRVDRVWNAQFKYNLLSKANVYVEDINDPKKKDNIIPVLRIDQIYEDYFNPEEKFYRKISGPGPILIKNKNEAEPGAVYANIAQMEGFADPIAFLQLFGITMTDEYVIREALQSGNAEVDYEQKNIGYLVDLIKNRLESVTYDSVAGYIPNPNGNYITNLSDLFKGFQYKENKQIKKQEGLAKVRNRLRDLEYAYSNQYTNFSSRNSKGDLQSERSYNSSLLMNVKALNAAASIEDVINTAGLEHLDPAINPQVMASAWLVNMFQLDNINPQIRGKRDYSIQIIVDNLSGNKFISKKKFVSTNEENQNIEVDFAEYDKAESALGSDFNTKIISDFYLTLSNRQEIMRSEAKSTSLTVHAPYKNQFGLRTDKLPLDVAEIDYMLTENYDGTFLYQLFKGHIFNDFIRRNRSKKLINLIKQGKIDVDGLAIDVNQLTRGAELIMFDGIFTPATIKEIDKALGKDFTETIYGKPDLFNIPLQRKIEADLRNFFVKESDNLYVKDNLANILPVADNFYEKYNTQENETPNAVLSKMIFAFSVNNYFSNLNYAATFLGDASSYDIKGEKFHKRIAGFISTGSIFRNDAVWLAYVNSTEFNNYGFAKKHNAGKENVRKDFTYNGNLQTAIMADPVSNSVFKEQYNKVLNLKEEDYEGMEEADGQAYITFDTYRLLNRSLDEWSEEQENLYQKMLAGEKLSAEDVKITFPVRKFQFYGTISNEKSKQILEDAGLYIESAGFHKFSLMPLVPELIKNSPALVKLHESMMEQGVDYVTMKSGSKLATLTKIKVEDGEIKAEQDDFYNANDRKTNDITWTKNTINVRHLKSQIFLKEGYKGYVTLPTQLRKIALNGILDNGVPFDFLPNSPLDKRKKSWSKLNDLKRREKSKKWNWYQEFVGTLKSMENLLKSQLLEDLALKEETVLDAKNKPIKIYTGDSKKLVRYLKEQLANKEILPEEISYITDSEGNLKEDLSFSLIGTKIEELLVTLVDKKLRRLKTNGEKLVQVSSAMWENAQWKTGTEADHIKYGTSGLKFHFLKDENGNLVKDKKTKNLIVTEMEVKISLQGDFKKLLYTDYADGTKIAVYQKDSEGKRTLDYAASLQRLNESIKDPVWLSKYGKLIDIPGVRIPSQGSNAFIATRVAEFLPEYAGPIIIMASEVVVNTGTDYDVDAMFTLFKSIVSKYGITEQVKYIPGQKESVEQILEKIDTEEQARDILLEVKDKRWKEYINYLEQKQQVNDEVQVLIEYIKEARTNIKSLYQQKREVYKSKKYKTETKIEYHALIDKEIEKGNKEIETYQNQINAILSMFFETQIKGKDTRADAVQAEYEKYTKRIKEVEEQIESIEQILFNFEMQLQGRGIKGLQNRLSDLIQERVLDPDNMADLVKANTIEAFEKTARDAGKKVKRGTLVYDKFDGKKTLPNNSPFRYRYNLMQHQQMSVALDALGIAAISSTFYAVFTTFEATLIGNTEAQTKKVKAALEYLSDKENAIKSPAKWNQSLAVLNVFKDKTLKLNSNIVENIGKDNATAITLGMVENVDGQKISDLLSQLINLYVDAPNDPVIADMEGSKENTPTILFLTMAGVKPADVIHIMTNPLVVEFNENLQFYSGIFSDIVNDPNELKQLEDEFYDEDAKKSRKKGPEQMAIADLFEEYEDVLDPSITTINLNLILNKAKPFTSAELKKRIGKDITYRDFEILAQFLAAKNMAESLNDFTQLTKFDTTKISSISEAQDRIEKINDFQSIPLEDKIIPNKWFDEIYESPIGAFNNDKFIVDLFAKYYGVKNNPALILKSLGIKVPRGMDRSKVLSNFKDEFIWFLYQNAVYNDLSYVTSASSVTNNLTGGPGIAYKLVVDNNIDKIIINDEKGEVRFPENIYEVDYNKYTPLSEFAAVSKYFKPNRPLDYVKFRIEYKNLESVAEGMTNEEFLDRFGIFDFQNYSLLNRKNGRTLILQKAALYHTMNPYAMFDSSNGVVNVLQNIYAKYRSQLENFAFFRDFRPDYSESLGKMNLFLPEIKNAEMAKVYRENIAELKNNMHEEVRDFFGKFNHIALMQTGLLATSKYALTKITNQSLLESVIENEIGIKYIEQVLDEVQDQVDAGVKKNEIDGKIIDQFLELYQASLNNNSLKVRGYDYTVNELRFGKVKKAQLKLGQSIVTVVNSSELLSPNITTLSVSDFYKPGQTEMAIATLLLNSKKSFQILNQKFVAPIDQDQAALDKALLILGIDNRGELPKIKARKRTDIGEGLSIQESRILKDGVSLKDEAMANRANKAIAQATEPLNPKYKSSTQAYIDALESGVYADKNVIGDAKSRKKQYNSKDKVWIFGSGIFANAYKGRPESEYIAAVQETFVNYHKKLIKKAVREGVETFIVGNASGIDQLAKEYLIEELGFVAITQYTNDGVYFEMVPAKNLSNIVTELYSPAASEIYINQELESTKLLASVFKDTFYKLDKEQQQNLNADYELFKELLVSTIKNLDQALSQKKNYGFRAQLSLDLLKTGASQLKTDASKITLVNSRIEKALMEFRLDLQKTRKVKEVKIESSSISDIYDKLPKQTAGGNVVIVDQIFKNSKNTNVITAYRLSKTTPLLDLFKQYRAIGNPFVQTADKKPGQAGREFIAWLEGTLFKETEQEYRQALLDAFKAGTLKDMTIEYYRELNAPSHANILDYYINTKQYRTQEEINADELVKNYDDIFKYEFLNPKLKESILKKFSEKWKNQINNPIDYINQKLSDPKVSNSFIIQQLKDC